MKVYVAILTLLFTTISIAQKQAINQSKFVSIGGIEQWVTIKGDNIDKPVLLFLHGGPGSTMSPYSNAMYKGWEKEYVLVNWDQRGAGKTYGRNFPSAIDAEFFMKNPLSLSQMVADGVELSRYLIKHLNKDKITIISTSWGSILGVKMALSNPELYYAYIGHAQFVSFSKNINNVYSRVLKKVEKDKDLETTSKLELLGKPPYLSAKKYGQLLRIVKKQERKKSILAPVTWFQIATEYNTKKDIKDREQGDDYSFLNFVGHKKLGIKSMASKIDFSQNATTFKIPVYLIQGEQDILTSKSINKPYFDKITAPDKKYFLLPNAGHGHNQSVIDKQYEVLNKQIFPKR